MNNEITTTSNPNGILSGNSGDVFYREGDIFYMTEGRTGKTTKLNIPVSSFLGKYNAPLYKDVPVFFSSPSETWIKARGTNTKTGWVFLVSKDSITNPPIVVPVSSHTPTPTPTPTLTITPTVTRTPAVTDGTHSFTPTPTPTQTQTVTPTAGSGGIVDYIEIVMTATSGKQLYISPTTTTGYAAFTDWHDVTRPLNGYSDYPFSDTDSPKTMKVFSVVSATDLTPSGDITVFTAYPSVSDISFHGTSHLIELDMYSQADDPNLLTSIDISNLTDLESLSLNQNSSLSQNTIILTQELENVTEIDLSYDSISTFDLSKFPSLTSLSINSDSTTSLTLTGPSPVKILYLAGSTTLETMSLSNLSNVIDFDASGTPNILQPDLTSFTSLLTASLGSLNYSTSNFNPSLLPSTVGYLSVGYYGVGTSLTSIDCSGLNQLDHINLNQNSISNMSDINIPSSGSLHTLELRDNPLSTIDVSDYPSLKKLSIGSSTLSSIIVGMKANVSDGIYVQSSPSLVSTVDFSQIAVADTIFFMNCNLSGIILPNTRLSTLTLISCPNITNLTFPAISVDQISRYDYSSTPKNLSIDASLLTHWNRIVLNGTAGSTTITAITFPSSPSSVPFTDFRLGTSVTISQAIVDSVLEYAVQMGTTSGYIDVSNAGNIPPSAAGLANKATLLSAGWAVDTN